jgi:hypothetical protein
MMGRRKPVLYTLGIDPGVTTGWAVLDHHGEVWDTGEWTLDTILDGIDWVIRGVNRTGEELEACQEILADRSAGQLDAELKYVQAALERVIVGTYDVHRTFVLPGTWKPHRSVIDVDEVSPSKHVMDAVKIATWRMWTREDDFEPRPRFLDLPGRRRS